MTTIGELIQLHKNYLEAVREAEEIKVENAEIDRKDKEFSVKEAEIREKIKGVMKGRAKEIWNGMDQDRFTYTVADEEVPNPNPYYGPDTITKAISTTYLSVMGLRIPVDRNERSVVYSVEESIAARNFDPKRYLRGILEKFELDPEGTKKAVCESVRVRMMKDRASCPVEIGEIDKEIKEMTSKIASLEKLEKEELPDNAIMRKIFKKKFEAKAGAPAEIRRLRNEIETLESRKSNLEYRAVLAEKLTTAEAIEQFVEEELKFLKEFAARDWRVELGSEPEELTTELRTVENERKALRKNERSSWDAERKVENIQKAFEKGFSSLVELFGTKEFVEELKSIDVTKLSEEERKIVETVREQYEQYLARTVAKYED